MRFTASACRLGAPIKVALLLLCALTAGATRAGAVETEVRDFAIEVDGKNSGQFVMTITRQDDGTLSMQSQANLRVKSMLYTYEYTFQGTEHWKDGRLVQITSKCNDDGTRYDLSGQADGQSFRLKVNGKERVCRWDMWTTSYWQLADKRFHNQGVPLLDSDCGKEYAANLQYVGVKQLLVNGQAKNCYQFRVTGGPASPIELYYDEHHRIVREEFTDQGKRIVFNLRSIQR